MVGVLHTEMCVCVGCGEAVTKSFIIDICTTIAVFANMHGTHNVLLDMHHPFSYCNTNVGIPTECICTKLFGDDFL